MPPAPTSLDGGTQREAFRTFAGGTLSDALVYRLPARLAAAVPLAAEANPTRQPPFEKALLSNDSDAFIL